MARPACDVTIGTETLHEMLTRFGQVHRIVRPHLQRYLLDLDTVRAPSGDRTRLMTNVAQQTTNTFFLSMLVLFQIVLILLRFKSFLMPVIVVKFMTGT